MLNINGASALVTGGASGLGEATARALGEQGAKVVIMDLEHQADKAAKILEDIDGAFMPTDVTDTDQVIAAVEKAKELGPLRALVNSAGVGWATRTIGKDGEYSSAHDLEVFRKVIDVNLVGTFNCTRLAATAMSGSDPDEFGERGAIVNTASVAALEGQVGQAAYSASKAGIVGMTLTIARDLAPVGVRVNTIIPGLFDTPIYGQGEAADQFKERLGAGCLFPKRLGFASEYASLASELIRNSYMNGESVRIDSGMRMQPK
jgi:NAD(P)-dependent dehydrogenase (short-subunit alcohol dehydrogenase family)